MSSVTVGPRLQYSEQLHAAKYRIPGESFRDAMTRVAGALQDSRQHYHEFREILLDMRFLPAGRVQSAMGAPKSVTPYNCFVGGKIPDSFTTPDNPEQSSIMHRALEAAQTMRLGGGLGNDFSTLRPKGARIGKINSTSTGPISFMGIFNEVGNNTSSTGERRGAQMGILRIDHPDIREFINAKHDNTTLKRFNISVGVTDEFMEALARNGKFDLKFEGEVYETVDAAELWETLMRSTWDWAEPGVVYVDRMNHYNNLWYCETLAATNPCFTADTRVWTSKGHRTFAELVAAGQDVQVLTRRADGRVVYRTMRNPRVTQRSAKLVEVAIKSTGNKRRPAKITYTRCTPEHNFYLNDGRRVMAKDLRPGDSIISAYRSLANSKGYMKLNGILEHHVPFENVVGLGKEWHVHHRDEVKNNNDPDNLELLPQAEHDAMHKRGANNPMVRMPERNYVHRHPEAVAGANNPRWRPELDEQGMRDMRAAGLSYAAIAEASGCCKATVMDRLKNHKVVSVRELDQVEDVYCGTVDETGCFFIALDDNDGVLVSNCAEQPLPPHGACLLGSYNLTRYVRAGSSSTGGLRYFDWTQLLADVPAVVRAMDNIVDRALYPLPQQAEEARSKRRMGLGVTGFANVAEALGYAYGTPACVEFEHQLLGFLTHHTYQASALLAAEKGAFPLYDADRYLAGQFVRTLETETQELIRRHGIRNSHLTSIAPTGTISMTADNVSSSVEPVYQWESERPVELPGGTVQMQLHDYGFREFQVRGRRAGNGEVTVKEHVDVLVAAQAHVDSAVSKTINSDGNVPWEDFKRIYVDAYDRGAKGCTTFNVDGKRFGLFRMKREPDDVKFPNRDVGVVNGGTLDAESCTWDPTTGRRTCE